MTDKIKLEDLTLKQIRELKEGYQIRVAEALTAIQNEFMEEYDCGFPLVNIHTSVNRDFIEDEMHRPIIDSSYVERDIEINFSKDETDKGQIIFDSKAMIKIYEPYGGYKSYGLLDKKVKEKVVVKKLPFDDEKRVFEVQCSKDGEKFVSVEPWATFNGGKIMMGKDKTSFPLTLNDCVILADFIARGNAETSNHDTGFKYWRIGIAWEKAEFCTWFSGDIGNPIIKRDMTMTDNFIPHFKL